MHLILFPYIDAKLLEGKNCVLHDDNSYFRSQGWKFLIAHCEQYLVNKKENEWINKINE